MARVSARDNFAAYFMCKAAELDSAHKDAPPPSTPQDCFRRRSAAPRGTLLPLRPASSQATLRPNRSKEAGGPWKARDRSPAILSTLSQGALGLRPPQKVQKQNLVQPEGSDGAGHSVSEKGKGSESRRSSQHSSSEESSNESEVFDGGIGAMHDDDYEASPEDQARAAELLQKAAFFRNLDEEVLKELPRVARFTEEPKGAVVFRQGDPPSKCWLIVGGEVGFFVGKMTPESAESPRQPASEGCEHMKVPWPWEDKARVPTLEGFSTYSLQTNLGKCVHKARGGAVFGELALMDNNAFRKAAAKCLMDCEFLTLPASAFQRIKEKLLQLQEEKKIFLCDYVPGMKEVPMPGPNDPPHPTFFFEKRSVDEDHVFLKQGVADEENRGLFVIAKGQVHMKCQRENEEKVCDTLHEGCMFGSLPHEGVEPFTVVAGSQCEVWQVMAKHFKQLPKALMERIQDHLSTTTARRLKHSCVNLKFGWDIQQRTAARFRRRKVEPEDNWPKAWINEVFATELRSQLFAASMGQKTVARWRH